MAAKFDATLAELKSLIRAPLSATSTSAPAPKRSRSKKPKQQAEPVPTATPSRTRSRSKSKGPKESSDKKETKEQKKPKKPKNPKTRESKASEVGSVAANALTGAVVKPTDNKEAIAKLLPSGSVPTIPYSVHKLSAASNKALCLQLDTVALTPLQKVVQNDQQAGEFNRCCTSIDMEDAIDIGSETLAICTSKSQAGASVVGRRQDFVVVFDIEGYGFLTGVHASAFSRYCSSNFDYHPKAVLYVTDSDKLTSDLLGVLSPNMTLERIGTVRLKEIFLQALAAKTASVSSPVAAATPVTAAIAAAGDTATSPTDASKTADEETKTKSPITSPVAARSPTAHPGAEFTFFKELFGSGRKLEDVVFFNGLSSVNYGIDDEIMPMVSGVTGFVRSSSLFVSRDRKAFNSEIWNRVIPAPHKAKIEADLKDVPRKNYIEGRDQAIAGYLTEAEGIEKLMFFKRCHLLDDLAQNFVARMPDSDLQDVWDGTPEAFAKRRKTPLSAAQTAKVAAFREQELKKDRSKVFGDLHDFLVIVSDFDSRRDLSTCARMGGPKSQTYSMRSTGPGGRLWHCWTVARCPHKSTEGAATAFTAYNTRYAHIAETIHQLVRTRIDAWAKQPRKRTAEKENLLLYREDIARFYNCVSFLTVGWHKQIGKFTEPRIGSRPSPSKSRNETARIVSCEPSDDAEFGYYLQPVGEYLGVNTATEIGDRKHPFANIVRDVTHTRNGKPRGSCTSHGYVDPSEANEEQHKDGKETVRESVQTDAAKIEKEDRQKAAAAKKRVTMAAPPSAPASVAPAAAASPKKPPPAKLTEDQKVAKKKERNAKKKANRQKKQAANAKKKDS